MSNAGISRIRPEQPIEAHYNLLSELMLTLSPLPPDQFLSLAGGISAALAENSKLGFLLPDLRPNTIAIAANGEIQLLQPERREPLSEAGWPYCSPERTGRMRRQEDERSTLYSLGIIFYEMLAGDPPFAADDPLDWMYMHLAQNPPSLRSRLPELPEALDQLVLKLLDKNPDNRFSSALSLMAALESCEQGSPAQHGAPGFYGREPEAAQLEQAFRSVCLGATEAVYVCGEAGIGKTRLIEETFRDGKLADSYYFISGKFEQFGAGVPYEPIVKAFRGLIRRLLGESEAFVEAWRVKLTESLGNVAGVIAALIPEARLLLETESGIEEELPAAEARKRFIYAFRRFAQVLAAKEHPIVLFIDDLQWADTSSLQLLDALIRDPECQYMLLVGAFRPDIDAFLTLPGLNDKGTSSEQLTVRYIRLTSLPMETLNRLAADTLGEDEEQTQMLSAAITARTEGNPFHFKQLLLRLRDERRLQLQPGKKLWQWQLDSIPDDDAEFDIGGLLEYRLGLLPQSAILFAETASCIGSAFIPELAAQVCGLTKEDCLAAWSSLEGEGLITALPDGSSRFVHDSIQKLIYSRIDESKRSQLHLAIGLSLAIQSIEGEDGGDRLFERAQHMNRGAELLQSDEERLSLADLNVKAGNRALASSAYDAALGYFSRGCSLLEERHWSSRFELCFELHARLAECAYLCGQSEESLQRIESLLLRARTPIERSRIRMIRIMQLINQGKYAEGTALGLQSLAEFGIRLSPSPGPLRLLTEKWKTNWLLARSQERLHLLPEITDPQLTAALDQIAAIVPSSFFTDKNIFFLLTSRALRLSLRGGQSPLAAVIFSAYGMLAETAWRGHEQARMLSGLGIRLAESAGMASASSMALTMHGAVISIFAGDAREADLYLPQAMRHGMNAGNYIFASYAMGGHVNSLYTRSSLSELERIIAEYMTVLETTKDEFVQQNFYLYLQWIAALRGRTESLVSFNDGQFSEEAFLARIGQEETAATTLYQYSTYKVQLFCLEGHYEEAEKWSVKAAPHEPYATHLPHMPECCFYEALALIGSCTAKGQTLQRSKAARIQKLLRRFRRFANGSPINFRARCTLLHAAYAEVRKQTKDAERLYDTAIREAFEYGDIRVKALGGELAGRFYERSGRTESARYYDRIALEGYTEWELSRKMMQLTNRLSGKRNEIQPEAEGLLDIEPAYHETAATAAKAQDRPSADLDAELAAILRATRVITGRSSADSMLAELMTIIMTYAGAGTGALLAANDGDLRIQVYAEPNEPAAAIDRELQGSMLLPEGIVRYVYRTQETAAYNGEPDSWITRNPYVAMNCPQSMLCLPVKIHGTLLGVLYLENRHATGVLDAAQTGVLLAMASQALMMIVLRQPLEGEASAVDNKAEEVLSEQTEALEEPLTERELEVLALLAAGLSNKEIAERLVIAAGTVKVHVKHIFAKLKVNRRTKAIMQAKELKLLQ
ncbi:helix-turn-helix transcriptional regulator [Paenibacillus radicis (ex Gao et al. 2016)]|uniref:Serine/threonine protein kinase n=1 Tax=Paenibacillus radicis (ex Gao et al. 2016) TaxID=1737354 RepID=A0A917HAN2_9BACL|nr:AAA family ATPase [Paenibacillus radicis (ex Gao et al. 2016)]GGG72379.1 serine/threonine protein kinase [Paenibacillus radicis (ex Gao et al. 2016)]